MQLLGLDGISSHDTFHSPNTLLDVMSTSATTALLPTPSRVGSGAVIVPRPLQLFNGIHTLQHNFGVWSHVSDSVERMRHQSTAQAFHRGNTSMTDVNSTAPIACKNSILVEFLCCSTLLSRGNIAILIIRIGGN